MRGEDDVLNELDENAIEAAVQLKESEEDAGREAEVVALTMGPEDARGLPDAGPADGRRPCVHCV